MGKTEINTFFLLAYVFLAVLVVGLIIFIFRARKRKLLNEKEKSMLEEQHRFEVVLRQFEVQQKTMHEIGQEIHDNVGQQLTLASLYTRQLQLDDRDNGIINQLAVIIDKSLSDLRSLSKTLTDNSVAQSSLYNLIENECKKVNSLGQCHVFYHSNIQQMSVGYQAKAIILRIVQEFLQNSLKHARCRNIWIELHLKGNNLELAMRDDGTGFDTASSEITGVGLKSMKKRALSLDAQFTLTSGTETGTHLLILIPGTKLLY